MLRSSPCVDKDTDSQHECSDGQSCYDITRPELRCFLLPLLKLYLSDEVHLFARKALFSRIYPGCKRSVGLRRRFVGHVWSQCSMRAGEVLTVALALRFQTIYKVDGNACYAVNILSVWLSDLRGVNCATEK